MSANDSVICAFCRQTTNLCARKDLSRRNIDKSSKRPTPKGWAAFFSKPVIVMESTSHYHLILFQFSQSMDMTWSWWIHFKAIRWRTSLSERGKPIVWMPSNWQWCIERRHCVLPKFLKRQRVRYASSADIERNCWTTFRVIKPINSPFGSDLSRLW